jgi:hypothetical protein
MSIEAMTFVKKSDVSDPMSRLLLFMIADHMSSETGLCWPGRKTLAGECRCSEATVKRHLAELEEAGIIERVERRREDGTQMTNAIKIIGFMKWLGKPETPTNDGGSNCAPRGSSAEPGGAHSCEPGGGSLVSPLNEPSLEPSVEKEPLNPQVSKTEPDADRLHREAYERGLAIKGGKVAHSARAIQRSTGELDGRRGITFADGKLRVTGEAMADLREDFPSLDLAEVCDRAAPSIARIDRPTYPVAMAELRKWARIVAGDRTKAQPPRRAAKLSRFNLHA